MSSLVIEAVTAGYGQVDVLHGVSFEVPDGAAIGVLGANGAGKTTLMRVVAGHLRAESGTLTLDGQPLRRMTPSSAVRRGIVLVAEGHEIVGKLSVEENLQLGAFRFWPRSSGAVIRKNRDRIFDLFPILAEKRGQLASLLSGGQQQMLSIGRALMSQPRLMLLDEPSLGLAPVVVEQIYERLLLLRRETGLSMIIVEQNSDRALSFCDRTHVMRLGELVAEAGPEEGLTEQQLRMAYFGT
jgi:branched-chain amino acid transport system ATP-binding protein